MIASLLLYFWVEYENLQSKYQYWEKKDQKISEYGHFSRCALENKSPKSRQKSNKSKNTKINF